MVELPTGTVTLVFTDIEGSTRLLRSLGDDYGRLLRAHRAILREAVAGNGGVEFGTEGDACFLAFGSAAAALSAAAEGQVALAAADWPGGARPRVRMGVHWSCRLLAPDERALLRRLSVFVGGWTWESAEAVAGAPEGSGEPQGGAPVDRDGPVDGLETLVEHSPVWRQETAASARFRMLATIREYAGERLEQAGERDRLRRRHASGFGERAQEAYLNIDSEDQLASLDWFDAEMANVRAALTREAPSWLEQIAAVAGDAPPDQRGPLLYWLGAFATRQGRAELADTLEILATMAAQEGETERVVRLLAGAAAIRGAAGGRP